jgi:hypothetical protein
MPGRASVPEQLFGFGPLQARGVQMGLVAGLADGRSFIFGPVRQNEVFQTEQMWR